MFVLEGCKKRGALPVWVGQLSRSLVTRVMDTRFLGISCVMEKSETRLHGPYNQEIL